MGYGPAVGGGELTTGVQGAPGCPWGCPNDSYEACDRNGSRLQCDATCCPAHLGPDAIIRPDGSLRSQWEMDGGARNIRPLGGDPNFNSGERPTANAVPVGHSPGPWRVADHGGGLGVRDGLGRRVASLRYKGSSVSARVPVGENIGNARLIAAAPDLLAACKLVAEFLATDKSNDWTEELAVIRAAIARADVSGSTGPAVRAVITLDGGLVQDVYLDPPGTALIIDYDVEGADPEELDEIYEGQSGYVHGDGEPWGAMHADVRTFAERTLREWGAEGGN